MSVDLSKYAAHGKGGMVAAARREAAEIGVEILKKGGNAFDAAVATSLALGVCEPECSSLGGGGFMTAHVAAENRDVFIDYREVAPYYATPAIWGGREDRRCADLGAKTVAVPGEPAGLFYILEHFGTMSFREVAEPAIRLAREGFLVTKLLATDMAARRSDMKCFEEEGNPYLRKEYKEGEMMTNPELADTMEILAEGGVDAFYRGDLTKRFLKSLNSHGGEFTEADFADYKVNEYEPIVSSYRDYTLVTSPLPSSGGIHVTENLNMLENFPISDYAFDSPERVFLFSEVFKKSLADRKRYTADPKYVRVPQKGMLSKAYAKDLAASIRYGEAVAPAFGQPFDYESNETTHFSVADDKGNLVAITQTISEFFGSAVIPANTGLVFNCQMRCFAVEDGLPNSVAPRKKPISSMCPTLLLKDGKPLAAIGSPGANRIITAVTQIVSNMADYGMNVAEAVFAPRLFNDTADVLHYEDRFSQETMKTVESFGQKIAEKGPFERYMGGANAIQYEADGSLLGVGDPRRDGGAVCCEPGEQYVFISEADSVSSKENCLF